MQCLRCYKLTEKGSDLLSQTVATDTNDIPEIKMKMNGLLWIKEILKKK
jgi:hypothetical protein